MKKVRKNVGVASATIIIIVLLMAISLAGGAFLWDYFKGAATPSQVPQETPNREIGELKPEETLKPLTPTPPKNLRPIASGSQTYTLSGKFTGPTIPSVTIDPLDAKAGQMQKISVRALDTNPVNSVRVAVKLDSKTNSFDLKLVSGNTNDGIWEGTSPFPDDTLNSNYQIEVTARSATGTTIATISIR